MGCEFEIPVGCQLPSLAQGNLDHKFAIFWPQPAPQVSGVLGGRCIVLHVCLERQRYGPVSCTVRTAWGLWWNLICAVSISFFLQTLLTADVGPWLGDCVRAKVLLR